jgi:hypothetical protein
MSRFSQRIRPRVRSELEAAGQAESHGEAATAFRHLERAHVLGQTATTLHVRVHWRMFLWAARQRKPAAAAGQIGRLVAALLVTGIGWLPHGNTGGSDVSAFQPMPIPADLQRLIDAARQ